MRVRDVHVGETYLVEVPQRLPPRRYPLDPLVPSTWWRWAWLRGARFPVTVTAVEVDADPPVVEGMRVADRSGVSVELTDEQCATLGLPPRRYRVAGVLYDAQQRAVELPEVEALWLPTRWLHPRQE